MKRIEMTQGAVAIVLAYEHDQHGRPFARVALNAAALDLPPSRVDRRIDRECHALAADRGTKRPHRMVVARTEDRVRSITAPPGEAGQWWEERYKDSPPPRPSPPLEQPIRCACRGTCPCHARGAS